MNLYEKILYAYLRPIIKHASISVIFSRANICTCRNYKIQSWWYPRIFMRIFDEQ